jgi:Ca2+-binding EF-hand superfamily protein
VTPEVRAKAFERWDINNDSFLTLDEYRPELIGRDNLEPRFKSFDKNGDGKLSREEFVGPTGK